MVLQIRREGVPQSLGFEIQWLEILEEIDLQREVEVGMILELYPCLEGSIAVRARSPHPWKEEKFRMFQKQRKGREG